MKDIVHCAKALTSAESDRHPKGSLYRTVFSDMRLEHVISVLFLIVGTDFVDFPWSHSRSHVSLVSKTHVILSEI